MFRAPMETDVQRVRQVLARELETISHYESLAAAAERPELRAFFLHLAEEEKEHVAEATTLLRRLDAGQELQFGKPFPASHFEAPEAPPAAPLTDPRKALHATTSPPAPHGDTFTVGSLRGPHA
ncbi:MAG TPA: ferritin family protein [Myxococcaceae bacterium]|nr:ferritin family protein [Myxococcaceae bacterium]